MPDEENEVLSYMGLQLYKSVFIILTVKREVPVDDPLNVNRELWRKLVHFELVDKVQSGASAGLETRSEFRIGAILQVLDELFLIDGHNKTASATSELFLNSALGRVLISKLHTLEGSSLLLHATNLLLKGLKAAKSHNRLQAEQNFYLNYSIVLLKHYVLGIGPAARLQKFMSSEAIDLLVEDNPLCLNLITRVVPKHIQRKLRASVNPKGVTSWRAAEWLNTLDLVNLELQKIDSGDACVSKLLIDRVKNYFSDFGKNWVRLPQALIEKIFQNVLHHKASSLADIARLVQIRHNFEEFDLEYSKSLNRLLVGRYFLTDLYVPSMANPTLLADIENPETFYQELINFYINQKEMKNKSECLKVICLVLTKYPQEKMKLIPYFVNEFNTTEDLAHQYYLMQFFSALISTNETYTRYNNLVEFLKNDGLALTFKTLQKSLMENVSDNVDLAGFVPNFSGLPLPRPATTKNQIRANTALVCLKILSNVRFFERAATGQIILETRMVPESRTAKFFSDADTLNLLVQLLLSKEPSVVEATLQVIHAAYDNQSLIFKLVSINTVWERFFSAGLRPGFAAQVSAILCHFTKTLQTENEKFDRELKDLQRLIPEYILNVMLKSSGPEAEFIFTEGQEVISAEAYWTNDMYSELRRVITQLFILDLQQLDDFYTGRKKAFPRVRAPPVKVQLNYEIPKELLSVDGVFINSLVEKGRYDFKDEKIVKSSLLERCLNLAEKRVTSKEFQSYDALAISDLRLSVQVILRFIYAERVSEPKIFINLGRLGVLVSQEWSKNATRLSVRGPQINYNVTNSLLDLIRCLCLHFDKKQANPETVAASFEIISTIVKKLLKKLQLGLGRLTYIDFKLLKSSIKLQGKVLASDDEETLAYIKRLLQDPQQDFDIHLVQCLRLLNKNLDLFVQLDPKQHQVKLRAPLLELDARPVEELMPAPVPIQAVPVEGEPAPAVAPADPHAPAIPAPTTSESPAKQASSAFAKIISKIKNVRLQELEIKRQKLREAMTAEQKAHAETLAQLKAQTVKEISQYEGLQEDLKVIGWNEEMEILESQQADVDLLTFDTVIHREELEHEVRSHFLKFNAYLLDLLKRYFDITEVLPTMVVNGVGYTLLQLLFSVYLNNQTRDDLRLIKIAAEYGTLFRKVLSLSCEAVISHYGQDFTTLEATLRGPHSNVLTERLEKIDREHQLPLVEFFRVIRKNFMWEFITKSIGNYGAFVHWANQRTNTEAFFNWLSSQSEVRHPTFIWSVAYAKELQALLGRQTDAILISRKVNYSHVLDSHQSPYLANFTRIGDLFLETLVQTHDYQFHEPQKLLKNLAIECDTWLLTKKEPISNDHLQVLLKSILYVGKVAGLTEFLPPLASFILHLLKAQSELNTQSQNLLLQLIIETAKNESSVVRILTQALILIRSNNLLRFVLSDFDISQLTGSLKLQTIVSLFSHKTSTVLLGGKGFDLLLLKSVISNAAPTTMVLQTLISLLNLVHIGPECLRELAAFIKKTAAYNLPLLQQVFETGLFFTDFILLEETKLQLLQSIEESINTHVAKLGETEEELEFDYSKVLLSQPSQFLKLGGYYLDVLLARPLELKTIDLYKVNEDLLNRLLEGPLTENTDFKHKLLALVYQQFEFGLRDHNLMSKLYHFTVSRKQTN